MTDEPIPKISDTLRQLADRIDRNADAGFSGAYALLPPGGAAPITMLIIDSQADAAMFWGTLKTTVENALGDLADQERAQGGYGRR